MCTPDSVMIESIASRVLAIFCVVLLYRTVKEHATIKR